MLTWDWYNCRITYASGKTELLEAVDIRYLLEEIQERLETQMQALRHPSYEFPEDNIDPFTFYFWEYHPLPKKG